MNKDSKINLVEAIFMGILVVSADALEALTVLSVGIAVIGQTLMITAWIYGFSASAIVMFWLIMKGVSTKWFLGGSGLDLIPIISSLPARSAAFVATLIIDWAPERVKKATNMAAKIIKK